MITRRALLQSFAAASALSVTGVNNAAASAFSDTGINNPVVGFGNGTYGMKSMKTEDAFRTLAEIGYDGVELCVIAGWPTDPANLSSVQTHELRNLVNDSGLALPAMLENLPFSESPEKRASNLERLKLDVALANELVPSSPPVIDTILGGKSADWERLKEPLAEELSKWAKIAEDAKVTVCFKPHAAQAVNSPERTIWLLNQVRSPRIRVIYDYSHFFVEGFPLASSLKELLPYTALISVKDSEGTPEDHKFLLPGDGKTNYLEYFRLLKELRYSGFVSVEVSAMVFKAPGYQPIPAYKLCYERLAPLFAKAGLRRPAHKHPL
jgi:sugar phosphate isomerase/epimerase